MSIHSRDRAMEPNTLDLVGEAGVEPCPAKIDQTIARFPPFEGCAPFNNLV